MKIIFFNSFLIWLILNICAGIFGLIAAGHCDVIGNGRWEYVLPFGTFVNWLFMGCL